MNKTSIIDIHKIFLSCNGVSIDSRTILDGQLFFALKGPNFDGHVYVEDVLKKKRVIAIIEDEAYYGEDTILVDNVEKTLQDLARFHRMQYDIPILGLTGSNGKTTTKELIFSVLSQKYNVLATKGNLNNHLGVPLTLLRINSEHNFAIIEMGANHQKEIEFLSEIAMPTMGLITNIGKAHLEGFGGIEGVRKGKTELYRYLSSVEGVLFYNTLDQYLVRSLPDGTTNVPYDNETIIIEQSYPKLKLLWNGALLISNLSGEYNVQNIAAAIKIGEFHGVKGPEIIKGIESYIPSNNRSEIKGTIRNTLILDAYNANPSSMASSITGFAKSDMKNKVLILGHMLEVGDESHKEHQELLNFVDEFDWDRVYIIGQEYENCKIPKTMKYFKGTDEFIKQILAQSNPITGKTILLKGSRGIALEKLVPYM